MKGKGSVIEYRVHRFVLQLHIPCVPYWMPPLSAPSQCARPGLHIDFASRVPPRQPEAQSFFKNAIFGDFEILENS